MSRREFLKTNTTAVLSVAAGGSKRPEFGSQGSVSTSRRVDVNPVRIAVLGTGNRGRLWRLINMKGVEVPASAISSRPPRARPRDGGQDRSRNPTATAVTRPTINACSSATMSMP
jgi:hypothetical protein